MNGFVSTISIPSLPQHSKLLLPLLTLIHPIKLLHYLLKPRITIYITPPTIGNSSTPIKERLLSNLKNRTCYLFDEISYRKICFLIIMFLSLGITECCVYEYIYRNANLFMYGYMFCKKQSEPCTTLQSIIFVVSYFHIRLF